MVAAAVAAIAVAVAVVAGSFMIEKMAATQGKRKQTQNVPCTTFPT